MQGITIYQYNPGNDSCSPTTVSADTNSTGTYNRLLSKGFTSEMTSKESLYLSVSLLLDGDFLFLYNNSIRQPFGQEHVDAIKHKMWTGYLGKMYPELFL